MDGICTSSDRVDKNWLVSLLKKEFNFAHHIICDIGCYDGKDSLEFIELFKPQKCTSYAFDIDDRSIEVFMRCKSKDPLRYNSIIFNKIAIADKEGFVDFYQSNSDSSRWRHYDFETSWSCSSSIKPPSNEFLKLFEGITFTETPQKVKSTSLDKWCTENLDSSDLVSILWVDVNGGEQDFLIGAQEMLKRTKILVIEFSNKTLYEGQITLNQIISDYVPESYKLERIYNFKGNYGDAIFVNQALSV